MPESKRRKRLTKLPERVGQQGSKGRCGTIGPVPRKSGKRKSDNLHVRK